MLSSAVSTSLRTVPRRGRPHLRFALAAARPLQSASRPRRVPAVILRPAGSEWFAVRRSPAAAVRRQTIRCTDERLFLRPSPQQASRRCSCPDHRHRRAGRRWSIPATALRIRAAADRRLAQRRRGRRGADRDPGHRQGDGLEVRHGDAVARRHRAQPRHRAVRPAGGREEDRGGAGQGAGREGRSRRAARHRARRLALERQRGRVREEHHDRHHAADARARCRRSLRQFRRRGRDRLQGVGGHGDERRQDRQLLLPRLRWPGEGPSGSPPRAVRASVRRTAGGEAHAGRHGQGRQHARDAACV